MQIILDVVVGRLSCLRSVYVFGFFQDSPGKTVVSSALCRGFLNRGLNVAPFKPRSGHSVWFQYDTFKKCKGEARLFCEDVVKLREAARCQLPYEILNPVDSLMAPLDAGVFLKENNVEEMYLKQPDIFSHLLVERYTRLVEGGIESVFCYNEKNLSEGVLFDGEYINHLKERAEMMIPVRDVTGWASVFGRYGPASVSSCYERIAEKHDPIVVEGFNDAACPTPQLGYKAVLGVGPGTAALYRPDDFQRAIKVRAMTISSMMGLRAKDVISFIKPEMIMSIPALSEKTLRNLDRLSVKLEKIVDVVQKQLE